MAKKKNAPKPKSSSLWIPKEATLFDPEEHSLATVAVSIGSFLPYKRNYTNLTPAQLQTLIRDAKRNRWEALDLHTCDLKELPEELWTLTDLHIIELGSVRNQSGGKPNHFSLLPRGIEKLTKLQTLSIWWSQLHSVQHSHPLNLPNLRHLNLTGAKFPVLPEAFAIPSLWDFFGRL